MERSELNKIDMGTPIQLGLVKKILAKKYQINLPQECDTFLIRCLRTKDNNVEKTVKLVISFQKGIADIEDWKVPLKPSAYEEFYRRGPVSMLQQRDSEGRRVFLITTRFWDPREISFEAAQTALWMMCEYCNSEHFDMALNGFVVIWDFSNFTWQQAWSVNQWKLLTTAKWAQNGVGGRVKQFHAINHPTAVGLLYSGIRPFLSEKLKRRIVFHNNLESLHKIVNAKILPDSLGGLLSFEESIDERVTSSLIRNDQHFIDLITVGFPLK